MSGQGVRHSTEQGVLVPLAISNKRRFPKRHPHLCPVSQTNTDYSGLSGANGWSSAISSAISLDAGGSLGVVDSLEQGAGVVDSRVCPSDAISDAESWFGGEASLVDAEASRQVASGGTCTVGVRLRGLLTFRYRQPPTHW